MSVRNLICFILMGLPAICGAQFIELHPNLPEHVVFRPTFLTRDYSFTSGTGFLAQGKSENTSYLVTVHHLFGPVGGLKDQMSGSQIPSVFLRAVGFSFDKNPVLLTTDEGIPVHDARKADTNGSERDIALFSVKGWAPTKSLVLSKTLPKAKDPVWVILRDVTNDDLLFAEAVVAWTSSTEVRYLLLDPSKNYSGASGAPVVNKAGEVVAMHVGLFTGKSGKSIGFGCPSSSIFEVLPEK